jgi:uncharacterized protein (TIGR00255 family)
MTGYGRSDSTWREAPFTVEVRSVNNRFLEVGCKLPKPLAHLETLLRTTIRNHISRGSITCVLTMGMGEKDSIPVAYNERLVREYLRIAQDIQSNFRLPGEVTLNQVLTLPDLFQFTDGGTDAQAMEAHLLQEIEKAMVALRHMRIQEGENLAEDLRSRIAKMESLLNQVQVLDPQRIEHWRNKFQARVQELMGDSTLDPVRVLQEASIIADRLDITEEITRFHSHNQLFLKALNEPSNQGKKLNFILQEMGREANTLGTKCQTAEIAEIAIALKEEVETIREQVQNIE